MPNWLQYNGVQKLGIATPRQADRPSSNPDWQGPECDTCRHWNGSVCAAKYAFRDCAAIGKRFRLLDARDLKRN